MAGEIQLNSTTMATESSGTITLSNVNSATNRTNLGLGSMATQNANAVALTGGSLTGTEIDLKSSGTTIYKSDGTTAVLSESGGVVTLSDSVKHVIPIVRTWLSSDQSITSGTTTKVGFNIDTPQSGGDAYKTAIDTHSFFNATGSTVNSVPSHSFLPTIAGYYFVSFTLGVTATNSGSYYRAHIVKNGSNYSNHFSIWSGITEYAMNLTALVHMNGSTDYLHFAGYLQANGPVFYAVGGTSTHAEMFLIQRD